MFHDNVILIYLALGYILRCLFGGSKKKDGYALPHARKTLCFSISRKGERTFKGGEKEEDKKRRHTRDLCCKCEELEKLWAVLRRSELALASEVSFLRQADSQKLGSPLPNLGVEQDKFPEKRL